MIRFHHGWGQFVTADGGEVWSLTTNERFAVRGKPNAVEGLFTALRSGVTDVSQLERKLGLPVGKVVDELLSIGAVVDDSAQLAGSQEPSIYLHQAEFFSLWESADRSGHVLQDRLRNSTVLIVGIGAFGTWIAQGCARIGIRNIVLVDPDTVESTNLPRQVLYRASDVGRPKVEVAAEVLTQADPTLNVTTHQLTVRQSSDLDPVIAEVDLVFNAFGYRGSTVRDLIAEACIAHNTPSLLSGGSTLGPLCEPGVSACYQCMVDSSEEMRDTVGKAIANRWTAPRAPFGPLIAVMSSLSVWEATKFLTGCAPVLTRDSFWSVDLYGYRMTRVEGSRRDSCTVCGTPNE